MPTVLEKAITDTIKEAKNLRLARSWAWGVKPTIILLKEHSSKMTSNDIMLYSSISASLSPH